MFSWQKSFLDVSKKQAEMAPHIFAPYAACEMALESGFGHSALYIADRNGFGMKQHKHPIFGTHNLPTKEVLDGKWEVVNAAWIHYPTIEDSFRDRMATLQRLASFYPHYKAALEAKTGEEYVRQVSLTWSTDPHRADKVLDIYNSWGNSISG